MIAQSFFKPGTDFEAAARQLEPHGSIRLWLYLLARCPYSGGIQAALARLLASSEEVEPGVRKALPELIEQHWPGDDEGAGELRQAALLEFQAKLPRAEDSGI